MKPNTKNVSSLTGNRLSRTASVLALALLAPAAANAAVIYEELFDNPGATDAPISTVSWTAYRNNGTEYSNGPVSGSPGNELVEINASDFVLVASSSGTSQTHFALLSDAGTIDPTLYTDLTISFTESATDDPAANPEMGWRALAQVGSTIYVSSFIGFNATATTHDLTVANSIWHVWTGETNLTNGFDIADISGTAGNLPAGNISGLGILAIDGDDANDRMRLFDYSITGVPEPSAALLSGLGLLCLLRRRR